MQLVHKGFTFIEMMVALVINVILLAAMVSVFSSNIGNFTKVVNNDTLNQQLQTVMQLMAADIRRAGYWSNAANDIGTDANTNPYQAGGNDISASGSCLLLTYDSNNDGTLPAISSSVDDERYGYRLTNQVLQARPRGAPFNCNSSATTWENVTNPNSIQITNLTFVMNTTTLPVGETTKLVQVRKVTISVTGRLTTNTSVTRTLTQQVRIRNDKFVP